MIAHINLLESVVFETFNGQGTELVLACKQQTFRLNLQHCEQATPSSSLADNLRIPMLNLLAFSVTTENVCYIIKYVFHVSQAFHKN